MSEQKFTIRESIPYSGGSAFPQTKGVGDRWIAEGGMTLRDKFADSAMPELLAEYLKTNCLPLEQDIKASVALDSYAMADAMIWARDKQQASPGHNSALDNLVELTKKLNDTRATLVNLIDAQQPVSNTAFNLGQDSKQWKLINSHIDALDAAVNAAREVVK